MQNADSERTRGIPPETINRNWTELVQELRSTQTGVQVLTAFLLTVPFTDKFDSLDDVQRTAYLMVLAGAVTAAILSPIATTGSCSAAGGDPGWSRPPNQVAVPGWCWWR